ncbi:hypothetical protein CPLU01_14426 [Colletotrichum plurivorum]|uniref:Uncharacterized protein n=1 Tax=Colletotrichum plurivorum TaxID=2175906 RepID=A0A8H6MZW2_9PEZI|nr:hypothetical protein CPLU01_14426 [Colletotrichum plurivorum]
MDPLGLSSLPQIALKRPLAGNPSKFPSTVLLLAPGDLSNHGPPCDTHTTFPDAARRLQQRSAGVQREERNIMRTKLADVRRLWRRGWYPLPDSTTPSVTNPLWRRPQSTQSSAVLVNVWLPPSAKDAHRHRIRRGLAAESKKALDQDTGSLVSAACHRICIDLSGVGWHVKEQEQLTAFPRRPVSEMPALQDVLATRANYFPAPIPLDDSAQSNGLHQRISRAHAAPPARRFPFPQRLPQIPNDEPAPSARSRRRCAPAKARLE